MKSVPVSWRVPIVPVTVTGTASPSDSTSSTWLRVNRTVRTPGPSSPMPTGAAGSTGTTPFRRSDEITMSAGV